MSSFVVRPTAVSTPRRRMPLSMAIGLGLAITMGIACLLGWRWLVWNRQAADRDIQAGRFSAAENRLRWYTWAYPNHNDSNLDLARILVASGRADEAVSRLERVQGDSQTTAVALLRRAEIELLARFRAREAERLSREAIRLDPDFVDARRLLLFLFRWQERFDDALPIAWAAIDRAVPAERHRLLATLFQIQYGAFPVNDTAGKLNRFIAADPDDVDSKVALADLQRRETAVDPARQALEALQLPPTHLQGRTALARCYLDLGEAELTARLIAEWPQASRDDPRYHRLVGMDAQINQSDFPKAVTAFRQLLKQQPDDAEANHRLAKCLFAMGRTTEAEAEKARAANLQQLITFETIEKLITECIQNLDEPQSRVRMARYYRQVGLARETRAWYESTLLVDPTNAEAQAYLAQPVPAKDNR